MRTSKPDVVSLIFGVLITGVALLSLWLTYLGSVDWHALKIVAPLSLVVLGVAGLALSRNRDWVPARNPPTSSPPRTSVPTERQFHHVRSLHRPAPARTQPQRPLHRRRLRRDRQVPEHGPDAGSDPHRGDHAVHLRAGGGVHHRHVRHAGGVARRRLSVGERARFADRLPDVPDQRAAAQRPGLGLGRRSPGAPASREAGPDHWT